MKTKKSKPQGKSPKNSRNFFKEFLNAINTVVGIFLIVVTVLYLLTDYAMTNDCPLCVQYFDLTKETAAYMHHQLTLPFCALMLVFIIPNLIKK